jgi:uncharacterized protein
MEVVDTNILVYAANADSPFHAPCRDHLAGLRARPDAWFLTWGIAYEFLRVVTHPRVLTRPWEVRAAWGFLEDLLASPGLIVLQATGRHPAVARAVFDELPWIAGSMLHDTRTAILMREHGISRIATRDADFRRFPFLEVIDPAG